MSVINSISSQIHRQMDLHFRLKTVIITSGVFSAVGGYLDRVIAYTIEADTPVSEGLLIEKFLVGVANYLINLR